MTVFYTIVLLKATTFEKTIVWEKIFFIDNMLTIVNEGLSLMIVNEGLSLTIVNETTNFIETVVFGKTIVFEKSYMQLY